MKRLKGPELKMPELKAPDFLVDLYYDLRDRRLLPLVALVIVAIAVVPFLLGGDGEEEPIAPASTPGAEAPVAGASSAKTARLTVVEAKPGLRDYRKRLRDRTPTDPFKQRFSGASVKAGQLGSKSETGSGFEGPTSTSTTTEPESVTATETNEPSGGASPGDSGSPTSGGPDGKFVTVAVDVHIVRVSGSKAEGTKKTSKPMVKRRVLPTTTLPNAKTQVITFMGLSPKTLKPTFLVSTDVTSMSGEGKCAAGTDVCQLVELEPGFLQIFELGEGGPRYKVKVLDLDLVTVPGS